MRGRGCVSERIPLCSLPFERSCRVWWDKGIRANAVSPGNTYFYGGIWQQIETGNPGLFAQAMALNPTGRMASPEEVARGIVLLASPASSFIRGTILVIDGALTGGV